MQKKQFIIRGMHCASCALTIERALKGVVGVKNANVNIASEKATVEFDDSVSKESLVEAVKKSGYELLADHGAHNMKGGEHDHHKLLKEAEINLLRKKFIFGAILSAFVVLLSFPDYFHVGNNIIATPLRFVLLLILTTPVEFWIGAQFWRGAWFGLKNFTANMDTLVALGTGAAFIFSSIVTALEIVNWKLEIPHLAGFDVYFDVAAVVITLVILGKYLEAKAKGSASDAIKKLLKLQAKTARVIHEGGHEMDMPIEEVKIGDIILVRPGEKFPVDGATIDWSSAIDESMDTGESMPVDKHQDDEVIGATINKTGAFKFRATKVGKETFLAQIIKLVEEAQGSKAPIQKFADKITGYFVPVVLSISILSFVIWIFLGHAPALNFAIINAVAVLVVACPCALGLATPTAIMVGTGKAAEKGIIIRDAEALELAGKIDTIILDKTGTLTKGEPAVTDIISDNEDQIIQIAASLEKFSEHPIAKAVVAYAASLGRQSLHPLDSAIRKEAEELKTTFFEVKNFKAHPGKGIEGEVVKSSGMEKMFLGNRALLKDIGVEFEEKIETRASDLESEGKTVLFLASQNKFFGAIAVADVIKENSVQSINLLNDIGVEVWMITGDNERTARAIGEKLGIKNIMARVLPNEKSEKVKELQAQGKRVAMVGDGINDAPALAQADVGIAIGTGTDVAIESGDITLISGDPIGISEAIGLSRKTLRNIKQNLFWASIYNIILIPLAAGALWPFFGILLNPILAGGAMAFSSVSVVLNSLRLKRIKF